MRKKSKREKVKLIFDENDRRDYLTGFHKRKQARRLKAKLEIIEIVKEEKRKMKKEKKEAFESALLSLRTVPEVEHLYDPVIYDLPDHTVTIGEIQNLDISTSILTNPEAPNSDIKDEAEKLRMTIKELKEKRIHMMQNNPAFKAAQQLEKQANRKKARRDRKRMLNDKHTKKKKGKKRRKKK